VRRRVTGPGQAPNGELDEEVGGPGDVDRREVERLLEVVRAEHDRDEVDRCVRPEDGEDLLAGVAELVVRVVDPGGAAAEPLLDDVVAGTELSAEHARPAGVASEPSAGRPELGVPAVRVRVAEADDRPQPVGLGEGWRLVVPWLGVPCF
jgi:hypothetical protein